MHRARARPQNRGERSESCHVDMSGTLAGVEVYTAPGMKAHFRLAFD